MPSTQYPRPAVHSISFREALLYWLKLGFINFGGPAGQMAMMHQELVQRKKWISEDRFLHAMKFCLVLPGPEAQQLAIYVGWLLHGTWGGIAAGTLFVLPSTFLLGVLAWVYAGYGDLAAVAAIFGGLKPVMVAIVAFALIRIGSRALRHPALVVLAGIAFAAVFFWRVPFPLVVLSAGLIGLVAIRRWPGVLEQKSSHGSERPAESPGEEVVVDLLAGRPVLVPTLGRNAAVLAAFGLLWIAPLATLWLLFGGGSVWVQQALFFTRAAFVTFGGAYAVLPYVAEAGVRNFEWVTPGEMLQGLALAETTPGPLIMFTQWVGFLGAWKLPGPLTAVAAGWLGAVTTTYYTFLPCFLLVFLGAPYVETLRNNRRLAGALTGITAAVVGVILNLTVFLAGEIFFRPGWQPDFYAMAVAIAALVALKRLNWAIHWVVVAGAGLGTLAYLAGIR
jgi:chromate transporter